MAEDDKHDNDNNNDDQRQCPPAAPLPALAENDKHDNDDDDDDQRTMPPPRCCQPCTHLAVGPLCYQLFNCCLRVQFGEGEWYPAPPWPQRWQGQVACPWRSISPSPLIQRQLSHMPTVKSVACASRGGGSVAAARRRRWRWQQHDGDGNGATPTARQWRRQRLSNSNSTTAALAEPARWQWRNGGSSGDCIKAMV